MKKLLGIVVRTVIGALLIAGLGLSGCQKQEGPAERAGKQIDKSMDEGGEKLQEAGKDIQKSAEGKK